MRDRNRNTGIVRSGGVKLLIQSCEIKISDKQMETSIRTLLRLASSNSESVAELMAGGGVNMVWTLIVVLLLLSGLIFFPLSSIRRYWGRGIYLYLNVNCSLVGCSTSNLSVKCMSIQALTKISASISASDAVAMVPCLKSVLDLLATEM